MENQKKEIQTSINLELVRRQFDSQAIKFNDWSVSRNVTYLKAYFDFCGLNSGDELMDVACGTGEFVVFCAPHITKATGIDISPEMIRLAGQKAVKEKLGNVSFIIGDVLGLPFADESFNVVVCRNALHHMPQYYQVFMEMTRCCRPGGRLSLLDIAAYDQREVNDYFETLEKMIDASHYQTLSSGAAAELFASFGLRLENRLEVEIELDLAEYLSHATQEEGTVENIFQHIECGLNNPAIAPFWKAEAAEDTGSDGNAGRATLSFRRNVFIVLGRKE